MKKNFILAITALILLLSGRSLAQSFTVQYDSAAFNISSMTGLAKLYNLINVPSGGGSVTLQWKVVSTTFPGDWMSATGICDNNLCYSSGSFTVGSVQTSGLYSPSGHGEDFHLQLATESITTPGCYKMKIKLWNQAIPTDSAMQTYYVCKYPASIPSVKSAEEVVLYPNPATNQLNVIFDAGADIKNIAVYNLIGKAMTIYRVSGNSANLNLENIPSGIYFLRLMNSNGQVVTTHKFTKQ